MASIGASPNSNIGTPDKPLIVGLASFFDYYRYGVDLSDPFIRANHELSLEMFDRLAKLARERGRKLGVLMIHSRPVIEYHAALGTQRLE